MNYRPMVDANHSTEAKEFAATFYEEQAARRDYSEAFKANPGSCAVWSLLAYLDAAQAVVYGVARGDES